ncbi:MAG: M16 family metallopeptidase, partial [Planctomycetota bacterium]
NRVVYKLFMQAMYRIHPARVSTIGFRGNFKQVTRDDLVRYYRNRYAPNNTVVAVAGDVDPAEIFEMVTNAMGAWARRPEPEIDLPTEPRQTEPRYVEKEMSQVRQAWVRMGYHTIDLFHPDLYALDMVSAVLSNGRSSRLHRRMVEKERLTVGVQTYSYTPSWRPGEFAVSFQTPAPTLERAQAVVAEEIERIKKVPVTQEELERAKALVVSSYQLRYQTVENQAEQVGTDLMTTGDPRFSRRYVQLIQAVTWEEVMAAARKYLDPNGLTVAVVRPLRVKEEEKGPEKGVLGAPEVSRARFPNGLTLLVKRTPGLGPAGVEIYTHGGLRAEPAGKNGVSQLTARLLIKGTSNRTAAEIAEQIESVGGGIGSQSGNNTIGLSLVLGRGATDLPFAVELLADVLANATFPEEELKKEKRFVQYMISRQQTDWGAESFNFMRGELFRGTPYANSTLGDAKTVEAITRADVVKFARAHVRPEAMVLAVAGDLDVEKTVEMIRSALGAWQVEGEFTPPKPPAPEWVGTSLPADRYAFKLNKKTQAVMNIAFPAPSYGELEDRAAMMVMDAFTSGINLPSGWFHNALRGGGKSLVYFVHLGIFPGIEAGAAYVYAQAEPGLLEEVHRLTVDQIERLRRGEFTDEELAVGRSMSIVSLAIGVQSVNQIAQQIALDELYGVGHDYRERLAKAIEKVTREDVMRVVGRYMKHMLVAVTGPKEV